MSSLYQDISLKLCGFWNFLRFVKSFETFRHFGAFRCSMSSLLSRRAQALCGVFTVCWIGMGRRPPRKRDCSPSAGPSSTTFDGRRIFFFFKNFFRGFFVVKMKEGAIGAMPLWMGAVTALLSNFNLWKAFLKFLNLRSVDWRKRCKTLVRVEKRKVVHW